MGFQSLCQMRFGRKSVEIGRNRSKIRNSQSKIGRKSVENLSKISRNSVENLSKIGRMIRASDPGLSVQVLAHHQALPRPEIATQDQNKNQGNLHKTNVKQTLFLLEAGSPGGTGPSLPLTRGHWYPPPHQAFSGADFPNAGFL